MALSSQIVTSMQQISQYANFGEQEPQVIQL